MKVAVTPECRPSPEHPDFYDHGETVTGSFLLVTPWGVFVDSVQVIFRDRRAKKNREPGHPWLTDPYSDRIKAWTTFSVEVEP